MSRFYLLATAINGFLVVMLGAFGAHALKAHLLPERLATWETSVQYQMFHTIALVAVAWLAQTDSGQSSLRWSGRLFVAGLVIFNGSLYLLALTGVSLLGAITPIGGVAWLLAWLLLGKTALAKFPQ